MVDADDDLTRRWQQVRDRFAEASVELPTEPRAEGTVVALQDGRRFGVWLMPDNRLVGKLEDFLATLEPDGDPSWGHAGAATREAQRLGAPLAVADVPKGQIHAWLAWRAQPGVPLGTAISSAVLRHDTDLAMRFVAWFDALFRA